MNQTKQKRGTGSISFHEVLMTKNELFKVTTDNDLYGTQVRMSNEGLINERTQAVMPLSQQLVMARFAPVSIKKEPVALTIENVLTLYKQGAPIRIELEDRYRVIQKKQRTLSDEEAYVKELLGFISQEETIALSSADVITINELINAKFYLHEDEC